MGPDVCFVGWTDAASPLADSFSAALMCFLDVRCASYTVFFAYCFWPGSWEFQLTIERDGEKRTHKQHTISPPPPPRHLHSLDSSSPRPSSAILPPFPPSTPSRTLPLQASTPLPPSRYPGDVSVVGNLAGSCSVFVRSWDQVVSTETTGR